MGQATFKRLAYLLRKKKQEIPIVTYDVDDILWGLLEHIAISGGLNPAFCTAIFRIHENWLLSEEEQAYVIKAFSSSDIFRNIQFYPGVSNILRPEALGAKVTINSNSYSAEIGELKVEQLLRAVPGIKPSNIQINVLDYEHANKKPLDQDTTFLIDDSPYNVAISPALVNLMPNRPLWTHNPKSKLLVQHKPVIWLPDLDAINDFVYTAVSYMMDPSYSLD